MFTGGVTHAEPAHHGMGSSLACGVQAISQDSDAKALILLLGDMSWIRPGTLETLLAGAAEDTIVMPDARCPMPDARCPMPQASADIR